MLSEAYHKAPLEWCRETRDRPPFGQLSPTSQTAGQVLHDANIDVSSGCIDANLSSG